MAEQRASPRCRLEARQGDPGGNKGGKWICSGVPSPPCRIHVDPQDGGLERFARHRLIRPPGRWPRATRPTRRQPFGSSARERGQPISAKLAVSPGERGSAYVRWFQGVIASLRRVFLMVSCRRGFVEGEC